MRITSVKMYLFSVVILFAFNSMSVEGQTDGLPCPDLCSLKPDSGGGGLKTPFRVWYFDSDAKECKRFGYSGRKGNRNRFRFRNDCETACNNCIPTTQEEQTKADDVCRLPVDPGRCDEVGVLPVLMYYFDSETENCQPFAHSGCGGNANKFSDVQECEKACISN